MLKAFPHLKPHTTGTMNVSRGDFLYEPGVRGFFLSGPDGELRIATME